MSDTLRRLSEVLESRRLVSGGNPGKSYIVRLFNKSDDAVLKKIGEEAIGAVMTARDARAASMTAEVRSKAVHEVVNLQFHTMVLLSYLDLTSDDVMSELVRREGPSGLEGKALRKSQARDAAGD